MDRSIFINSNSSIILAEGHARGFWHSWRAVSLGILLGLCGLLGTLLYAISRPLPWPADTSLFFVVSPRDAEKPPESLRKTLPSDWTAYLVCDTRWPLIIGVYRKEQGWYSFVMSPSWCQPRTEKLHVVKRGLIVLASDTAIESAEQKNYLGLLLESGFGHPALAVAPESLSLLTGIADQSPTGTWNWFRPGKNSIRSNIDLPIMPARNAPAADVSIRFSKSMLPEGVPFLPDIARRARLPNLTQADVVFGSDTPEVIRLSFDKTLNEDNASALLGAYGFTSRRAIKLPDGSISFERIEPIATSGTSLLGSRKDEKGRLALISGQTFTLSSASSSSDLPLAPACAETGAWARLSTKSLSALLKRVGLQMEEKDLRPIQIVSEKGKLAICFE